MAVEIAPAPDRARLSPISWAAVFASLAVGISVMLLLTLTGFAFGLTAVEPGAESARAITIGSATWQGISMLIAAFVGGYVAARLSGLRRTADGVLHGSVSWGATTVLYAALATTAIGTLTAGMFGLLAPPDRTTSSSTTSGAPDREQMQRTLEAMGMSAEQSRNIAEKLSAPVAGNNSGGTRQQSERTAEAVGTATGWLSATVLLSLVLSLIGGAMGSRGTRRINRRIERYAVAAPAPPPTTTAPDGSARVLSRQT